MRRRSTIAHSCPWRLGSDRLRRRNHWDNSAATPLERSAWTSAQDCSHRNSHFGDARDPRGPMSLYLILKYLHVIGAAVLLGTGSGIAFFMLMAHLRGDAKTIAEVARIVVIAD